MSKTGNAKGTNRGSSSYTSEAVHGGDIWRAARGLGVGVEDILDLSASLNPLGPPAGLDKALADAFSTICHYPDRGNHELRRAIAVSMDLKPGNILAGNGSTSLIRLLVRALDLKTTVVMAPSFGEFPRALAVFGRHFHYHMLSAANQFRFTVKELEAIWECSPSCLIITNPQTPGGNLIDPSALEQIYEQAKKRGVWLVLDEAFVDFAPKAAREWSLPLVNEYNRLLVLRSLTKFYCLAGLRLGFLAGHEDTINEFALLGEPWSVNTMAQAAGVYCLKQDEYALKTRQAVRRWREILAGRLSEAGLNVYPSQVNYLLAEIPESGPIAAKVAEDCAGQGVLIRDCASFPGCGQRHLRFAVHGEEDQDRLFEVLLPALKG